jgi:NADPH:quinone reductase-like Zn-dependent oxidoreductase
MKAMVLQPPIGLDRLTMEDRPDPGAPAMGEIRVALHGSSLNFHDLGVATGQMSTQDGRIPLADGAGIVEAVGEEASIRPTLPSLPASALGLTEPLLGLQPRTAAAKGR